MHAASTRGVVAVTTGSVGRLHRCKVCDGCVGVANELASLFAVDLQVSNMVEAGHHAYGGLEEAGAATVGADGTGVFVMKGSADIRGGRVERCVKGMELQGAAGRPSDASVRRTAFRDCESGVLVSDNCELRAVDCEFLGHNLEVAADPVPDNVNVSVPLPSAIGITFIDTGRGSVSTSSFAGYPAAVLSKSSKHVSFSDCEFTLSHAETSGYGMMMLGGNVSVEKCRFVGAPLSNTEPVSGLYIDGASDCSIRDCQIKGLSGKAISCRGCAAGTTTRVIGTQIQGCGIGVSVNSAGNVSLQDCVVTEGATGVEVGSGVLNAKRTTISARDHAMGVVSEETSAVAKLVECEVSGGHGGVEAAGPMADVSLLRCTIRNSMCGAKVRAGAVMRVTKSTATGCIMFAFDAGERLSSIRGPEPCEVCGRGGEAGWQVALRALTSCGREGVPGARCVHTGARARMFLTDVRVEDGPAGGVCANVGGTVVAKRVTSERNGSGFSMQYVSVKSIYEDCVAVDCREPSAQCPWEVSDARNAEPIPEIRVVKSRPSAY